ncbi:type VII secretion protein EccB [Mycobacterium kansasii 732]|uniref:ESX-1 secretion system ATPase EccB1 n=1 Tax=Mycobacterium pseudokansasii TaxID=2341080 RepID=A0A498QX68_9MYCO|nr:type VII secretion protein EccB [Mycobacterium pseudokansasii]EUA07468.1 type VII secretion protein EccB [Mycobacterium kansasii 732]KZS60553.1 type VII secretion protein EccB [Mycobacterium kansasii]VBA30534.1 ESX-1 secretion system ATPase EccB1 [Mycobacterium pseudokansasii]VBA32353.1 ESX-1 secretion system ATPase EccB1 [Mycobacterium pseudokansasii]VBA54456.1 ESX-1 secretion system ATPase EccB1 [Mycobacterium pseudokansasii]
MAGLRLTTKVQVSGWRFLLRRLEHALVRRDTRMYDDPLHFYNRSAGLGIVIAVVILGGAAMLAYVKPEGDIGGTSLIADRTTNQLYVILSGRVHPVYNLTSARLALGNPASPSAVDPAQLRNIFNSMSRGQPIGIPGAPYATPVSKGDVSVWTVCDTVADANSDVPTLQTVVTAMPLQIDPTLKSMQPNEALLASYRDQAWVVTSDGRHAFDITDRALTLAVGIPMTAKPIPLSEAMYNALPDVGSWQLPPVPGAGAHNSLGLPDDLVVGSVFQTYAESAPQLFVVLADGVAQVNAPTADALRAMESDGLVTPPLVEPSLVVRIPERIYASPLPDEPIKISNRPDEPFLCWSWQRGTGDKSPKKTVLSGRHLPLQPTQMNGGVNQIRGGATVFIDAGKFVSLQSPDPRYGELMYYIDADGVRYGVQDTDSARALGMGSPDAAPWEIIRLLVDGPVLSKDAALLEHETLPADPSPRRLPVRSPGTS